MSETTHSIMLRLRSETRDLHTHAETRQLQQEISRGQVPQEAFAEYLGQLFLAHRGLEEALRSAAAEHEAVAELATPERMRVPDLESDLAHYGRDTGELEPMPATARYLELIDRTLESAPVTLLGALYVLEGSTNGGKFLARVLRQAWQVDGGAGLAYFDPYGEDQPRMWAEFRRQMDALDLSAEDRDGILTVARATFQAIADVSDEVYRRANGH